jgi:ribosomal protein L37AE/L43A
MPVDPNEWDDEETMMALSDVLTQVAAGRTDNHECPRCGRGKLSCSEDDGWIKIRCPQCRLSFEGMLG